MYNNILNKDPVLKPNVSNAGRALLEALLHKDPTRRMGARDDVVSTVHTHTDAFHRRLYSHLAHKYVSAPHQVGCNGKAVGWGGSACLIPYRWRSGAKPSSHPSTGTTWWPRRPRLLLSLLWWVAQLRCYQSWESRCWHVVPSYSPRHRPTGWTYWFEAFWPRVHPPPGAWFPVQPRQRHGEQQRVWGGCCLSRLLIWTFGWPGLRLGGGPTSLPVCRVVWWPAFSSLISGTLRCVCGQWTRNVWTQRLWEFQGQGISLCTSL